MARRERPITLQKTPLDGPTYEKMKTLQLKIREEDWSDDQIKSHPMIDGHLAYGTTPIAIKLLNSRHAPEEGHDRGLQHYAILDPDSADRFKSAGLDDRKWYASPSENPKHIFISTLAREPVTGKELTVQLVASRMVLWLKEGPIPDEIDVSSINGNVLDLRASNLEQKKSEYKGKGAVKPPRPARKSKAKAAITEEPIVPSDASNENADPSKKEGAA